MVQYDTFNILRAHHSERVARATHSEDFEVVSFAADRRSWARYVQCGVTLDAVLLIAYDVLFCNC
jgi:hypothetical protein